MSIEFVEVTQSRKFRISYDGNSTVTIFFRTSGSEDEVAVRAVVEAQLSFVWAGDPDYTLQYYDLEHLGNGIYEGQAMYGLRVEPVVSLTTTGGTQKITQSIDTIVSVKKGGGQAPSFGGAIGVNNDTVEGCEIVVPQIRFTETYRLPKELMTSEYRKTLARLTGTINDAAFRDWQAWEVLFLGAEYTQRGGDRVEIAFHFSVVLNEIELSIGDLPAFDKAGWDYLWIRYTDAVDNKTLVKQPDAAYVENVYIIEDFSQLGIGTEPW